MYANAPEITGVISVCNQDDLAMFAMATQSMVNQTFPLKLLMVVSDGRFTYAQTKWLHRLEESSIIPLEMLEQYEGGVSASRNLAIQGADTEWIAFLDADDFAHPNRIEKQIYSAISSHVDVSGCQAVVFDSDVDCFTHRISFPQKHEEIVEALKINSPLIQSGVLARVEVLKAVGGYRDVRCEDYDLWIRLYANGARFMNHELSLISFSTNRQQLRRRGGLSFLREELRLHRLRVRCCLTGQAKDYFNLVRRSGYRLLPVPVKRIVSTGSSKRVLLTTNDLGFIGLRNQIRREVFDSLQNCGLLQS